MNFWIREVVGWLLIGLGLVLFYNCYRILTNSHDILEGGALTLVGIILFRGGIHLLKIAVAARVCLDTEQRRVESHRPAAPVTRGQVRGLAAVPAQPYLTPLPTSDRPAR
jgi:hypothetical protein